MLELEGTLTVPEWIYDMGQPICGRCICGEATCSDTADVSDDMRVLTGTLTVEV